MCLSVDDSPGCDVDVLEQAGEAVGQGDAQRPQQVVPAGLHVLTGPALGVTLAAHVLMVRSHYVGDEIVVSTGRLEEEEEEGGDFSFSFKSRTSDYRRCFQMNRKYITAVSDEHTCC